MSNEQAVLTIVTAPDGSLRYRRFRRGSYIRRSLFWPRRVGAGRFRAFTMALVEPFQRQSENQDGKPIALILTILLTLLVLSILVLAIVWSIGDVVHWGVANVERFSLCTCEQLNGLMGTIFL